MLDEYALLIEKLQTKSFELVGTSSNFARGSLLADASRSRASVHKLGTVEADLNSTKGKIGALTKKHGPGRWRAHTAHTHPMKDLPRLLSEEVGTCTQAYCKFFEILLHFPELTKRTSTESLKSLHLCEAPGMFVKALQDYLGEGVNWNWRMNSLNPHHEWNNPTGMITDDGFMCDNLDKMLFCDDDTGDIMQWSEDLSKRLIDDGGPFTLITADGSFDCTSEPNQQEHQVAPLVNMEVNIALACLEVGGSLVLKMYTFFNDETIATLETLMRCFDRVCIFKPQCSKPSNSEVYAVCTGFSITTPLSSTSLSSNVCFEKIVDCANFFARHQIDFMEFNLRTYHSISSSQRISMRIEKQSAIESLRAQIAEKAQRGRTQHFAKRAKIHIPLDLNSKSIVSRMANSGASGRILNSLFIDPSILRHIDDKNLIDLCTYVKECDDAVPRASAVSFEEERVVVACRRIKSKQEWITFLADSYRVPRGTIRLELLPCTLVLSRFSASVLYFLRQLHGTMQLSREAIVFKDRISDNMASPLADYCLDKLIEISRETREILSFVPVQSLRSGEFYSDIVQFNLSNAEVTPTVE